MVKQVIIIRKDLNMRKGKMIAQGCHASMAIFLDRLGPISARKEQFLTLPPKDIGYTCTLFGITEEMKQWITGQFTKIVVSVDSEEELLHCYALAKNNKLLCSLIQDVGKTEFHGESTFTAVAIGPAESEDIDRITGSLKLL